jgi:hypothetical protein
MGKPSWAFSLNSRARMSGAPPDGKVTTKRKGLLGKLCALAPVATSAPKPKSKSPKLRRSGEAMALEVGEFSKRMGAKRGRMKVPPWHFTLGGMADGRHGENPLHRTRACHVCDAGGLLPVICRCFARCVAKVSAAVGSVCLGVGHWVDTCA